ncbi:MAG: DUF3078 domain-containing protein [Balneolaceae bacterium]
MTVLQKIRVFSGFMSLVLALPAILPFQTLTANGTDLPVRASRDSLFAGIPEAVFQETSMAPPDLVPPDTLRGWSMTWVASLQGSQASYSNWSRGGVNSVSLNSSSLIEMLYQRKPFVYEFQISTRYGQARIEDKGVRKTDDQIALRNRFLYDINQDRNQDDGEFKLFGNVNFETQFSRGFDYGGGPEGGDILISDFLAPAYFSQSTGLAYYPDSDFSIEAGMGLKQTIVADTTLSTRYGLDEGSRFKSEAGFTFGLNYEHEIMENVFYNGYLETFTNLLQSVRRTDIMFSNQIVGKVNNHINVTFRFELIYDDDFSKSLQMGQALSAGLTLNLR